MTLNTERKPTQGENTYLCPLGNRAYPRLRIQTGGESHVTRERSQALRTEQTADQKRTHRYVRFKLSHVFRWSPNNGPTSNHVVVALFWTTAVVLSVRVRVMDMSILEYRVVQARSCSQVGTAITGHKVVAEPLRFAHTSPPRRL